MSEDQVQDMQARRASDDFNRLTYDDCTMADANAAEQYAVAHVAQVGVSKETMIDAISTLRAQVMTYDAGVRRVVALLGEYRAKHKECRDRTGHPDAMKSQAKDWRCELCREADIYLCPSGEQVQTAAVKWDITYTNCPHCGWTHDTEGWSDAQVFCEGCHKPFTQPEGEVMPETPKSFPKCECGGIALDNASGDITRTCIRCGRIVKPLPPQAAAVPCCEFDHNEDGNCHIHSAPGVFRHPTLGAQTAVGEGELPPLDHEEAKNWIEPDSSYLLQREAQLREAIAQRDEAIHNLAECYRWTGADSDGNEDWRLAERAVSAVIEMRGDTDAEIARLEAQLAAASPQGAPEREEESNG